MAWIVTGPQGQSREFPTRAQAREFVRATPGWRATGEYATRIERSMALGLTRAEARGHPPHRVGYVPKGWARRRLARAGVRLIERDREPALVEDLLRVIQRFRQKFPDKEQGILALHGRPYKGLDRVEWRSVGVDLPSLEATLADFPPNTLLAPIAAELGFDGPWEEVWGIFLSPPAA